MVLSYKMALGWTAPPTGGTLDPAKTGTFQLPLLDTNHSVSCTTNNLGVAMSVTGHSSGLYYFEYTCVSAGTQASGYYQSIGVCPAAFSFNTGLVGGSIDQSVGLRDDAATSLGSIYVNGSIQTGFNNLGLAVGVGQTGACAVDLTNKLIWFKGPGWSNEWNFTGGASPGGTGGCSWSAVTMAAPFYASAGNLLNAKYTVNLDGTYSTPVYGLPSGCTWWG